MTVQIPETVAGILGRSRVDGNKLFLPPGQLERKLYLEVDKVLKNIGGKWNRSAKAHLFEEDPSEILDEILITGEYTDLKKDLNFFKTPPEVVDMMIDWVGERRFDGVHDIWLEPSAGRGAILDKFPVHRSRVLAVEIHKPFCDELAEKGWRVYCADFLVCDSSFLGADVIIMNPPFTKGQDMAHVLHAWSLLRPGGVLVAIVSEAPFFRDTKAAIEFRHWLVSNGAEIIDLPAGTFKASGTMVKARMIRVAKGVE